MKNSTMTYATSPDNEDNLIPKPTIENHEREMEF